MVGCTESSFLAVEKNMKFVYNKYLHGEKTSKHFDQCGSHNDKNTFILLMQGLRSRAAGAVVVRVSGPEHVKGFLLERCRVSGP